jgi:hypothetical protein
VIVIELPYVRQLDADFTPRKLGFNSRAGHAMLVVDELAAGQDFSSSISVSPLPVNPQKLHSH